MTKTRRNIVIMALGVIAVTYIMLANYFGNKRTNQEFIKFDNSKIDGLLKEIYIKHHGVGFKLDGCNEEFIFYPNTSELNENQVFDHFAKSGDRIIKKPNSDTLFLIKKDKKYKFTFQRFNNK